MMMDSALIVEDMPDSQEWLYQAVGAAFPGIRIAVADSLASARRLLSENRFALAIIDLGLPDGTGTDLIQDIARSSSDTIRIVATIFDDDRHLLGALRAGAQGYLLKQQRLQHIVRLLKGITEGQPPLSPSVARRILHSFHQPDEPDDLTEREREVLNLIAKGFRIAEAAKLLGISHHTVHGHVKSIYGKLDVSSRAEAAMEAARRGIIGRF